jgi:Sulfotransferase family
MTSERFPTFLVVGAAKAGTTSLFMYLTQHPQVFGAPRKEPNFFALEGKKVWYRGPGDQEAINRTSVTVWGDYLSLFSGSGGARARGESSTLYLYSPDAAACIHKYVPSVRIVAILRNPVDRAFSSFQHLRRDGREPLEDFSDALRAEDTRFVQGWQHLWHYTRLGFYSAQLRRYYELFPGEQILVHLYDDLVRAPLDVVRATYEFIGVDRNFRPDVSRRFNEGGSPRSPLFQALLVGENAPKKIARRLLPPHARSRLWLRLLRLNTVESAAKMSMEARDFLTGLFAPEIDRLEELLGRDLSEWRRR